MTDDRTETITDPAEIRATDEPDEITTARYRALMATPLDGPMMRGETTPAPASGAGLDLDALHETICDNFTGMAEVRQAADLLVAEVRRLTEFRDWWKASSLANAEDVRRLTAICHDWRDRSEAAEAEVGTLRDTLARRTDSHTQLVRENETLRAKVAAVEAEKEAILGQVDQAARLLRLNGKRADAQTVIAQVRRWPEFVDRAALATGEGE